eukprot:CAMPEP_0174346070 /NCGR_PEP_ID=MMETSP0811_2-20130205/1631_1 /TAXON_ID=73025 ORGANISM="Eutreptiella gymnastica-like, Strain CCMP1594" /NCGR_SAMPLE_ID=MMETSP0811_2 /ASSEMBLY_ACC=CAM_ASM_000667 /LENGTH=66 /DNA_ID=CAMNT_0015470253 /DNA_START=116 /DNA_END=316 /DNA_ORIENTATION=-
MEGCICAIVAPQSATVGVASVGEHQAEVSAQKGFGPGRVADCGATACPMSKACGPVDEARVEVMQP